MAKKRWGMWAFPLKDWIRGQTVNGKRYPREYSSKRAVQEAIRSNGLRSECEPRELPPDEITTAEAGHRL